MALYKEIVTKAVVGKGKKSFKNEYKIIPSDKPTTVLGCWIINHKFEGYKLDDKIGVNGSFDVNIWYSFDSDSKTNVKSEKIEYNDVFNVKIKDEADLSKNTEIIVRALTEPTCNGANILETGEIVFNVEKELGVEIVGETKVKISIEEDEEPWDLIDDEVDEEVLKDIDNINEDYI